MSHSASTIRGEPCAWPPSLAQLGIATEPLFIAMPAGHRLRHRLEVRLAELADDRWFLAPDNGAGWPAALHQACAADGFTPAAVHEYLGDHQQLQLMVAQGMGVTVVHATVRAIPGVLVKPLVGSPSGAATCSPGGRTP
ncbi:LysR substrate-binding domain-containing protein [Kitasatospora acidiphila]|uniref:LysR substrate-binding domain-containing protein n=1 Tax=Kitasatospora acidiphila TaxID=2567942 RepID=UPI002B3FFD62|nr:LysR substrate-binding domain-containing protein [Kitasatospora acidiphila]